MRCQICNCPTRPVLEKEQNVSCGDYFVGRRIYERNLGSVVLRECEDCGFATFSELQAWPEEKFRQEIYNDDYHLCDPPFRDERPRKICSWLSASLNRCQVIDYGGGEGQLASMLNQHGFEALSYDPFYGEVTIPSQPADAVTAFEVVEHVPDQRRLFRALSSLCKPDGLIIFSTLLKPDYLSGDWWYASPRNGHVSFHTGRSLKILMTELKLAFVSVSSEIHVVACDEVLLRQVNSWPSVQVNDEPEFKFKTEWTTMQRT